MDTVLFLLIFTTGQREKNIEKTLFMSAVTQKMWKTAGSGSTLPQYLSNLYLHKVYLSYFKLPKAKTISWKVFKITDSKDLQQELTKGTLRP